MILSVGSTLRTVFAVFTAFWIVVIGVLLLGVGLLLKRHDRLIAKHNPGNSGSQH